MWQCFFYYKIKIWRNWKRFRSQQLVNRSKPLGNTLWITRIRSPRTVSWRPEIWTGSWSLEFVSWELKISGKFRRLYFPIFNYAFLSVKISSFLSKILKKIEASFFTEWWRGNYHSWVLAVTKLRPRNGEENSWLKFFVDSQLCRKKKFQPFRETIKIWSDDCSSQ